MSDDVINFHDKQIERLEEEQRDSFKKTTILEAKVDVLSEKVDNIKTQLNNQDKILLRLDDDLLKRRRIKSGLKKVAITLISASVFVSAIEQFAWKWIVGLWH